MSSEFNYPPEINALAPRIREQDVENSLISKFRAIKYEIRDDILARHALTERWTQFQRQFLSDTP